MFLYLDRKQDRVGCYWLCVAPKSAEKIIDESRGRVTCPSAIAGDANACLHLERL